MSEDLIAALRSAREGLEGGAGHDVFRKGLAAKRARVVTIAAKLLRDTPASLLELFEDDLLAALEAWLESSRRPDPGCMAMTALVQTLVRGEAERTRGVTPGTLRQQLRRGSRHVQWEKVYGGRTDVAGDLRIASAAGLVTIGDPDALPVLADHLADPLAPVRRAAARNLRARAGSEAMLLLRLRARIGDAEADVLGEVLRALLALSPDAADVAAAWLDPPAGDEAEAVFAEAALALAELGGEPAYTTLRHAWDVNLDVGRRRVLIAALGQIRSEKAMAFLIEVVREAGRDLALDAAVLLAPTAGEGPLEAEFRAAVAERNDAEVQRAAGLA